MVIMENEANVERNCFYKIVGLMILATDYDEGQNWNELLRQSCFTSENWEHDTSFLEESRYPGKQK